MSRLIECDGCEETERLAGGALPEKWRFVDEWSAELCPACFEHYEIVKNRARLAAKRAADAVMREWTECLRGKLGPKKQDESESSKTEDKK